MDRFYMESEETKGWGIYCSIPEMIKNYLHMIDPEGEFYKDYSEYVPDSKTDVTLVRCDMIDQLVEFCPTINVEVVVIEYSMNYQAFVDKIYEYKESHDG